MIDSFADQVKTPRTPNSISLSDSFETVNQSLNEAQANAGEIIERYYTIAGQVIRLRFAGPAMIPYVRRALEHVHTQPSPLYNLTINIWDSLSTRSRIPDIAWLKLYDSRAGAVLSTREGNYCMAYQSHTGVLSLLNIAENTAYYWVADASKTPYYEVARTMSLLLHWWFHNEGYQMLHAAAIGFNGIGVLLAGKSGSGKSTTALRWLEAGLDYVSDDYCLVGEKPVPTIYSIYNSAMIFPHDIRLYPSLKPFVAEPLTPNDEKRMVFISDKKKLSTSLRLKAFFLPRVAQQEKAVLSRVSASEAMKALAPSTLLQLPGASASGFHTMARLVKRVPSYRLELGADRHHAIELIRDFLESK